MSPVKQRHSSEGVEILPNEFQRDKMRMNNFFTESKKDFTSQDHVIEKNVVGLSIEPIKEKIENSYLTDQQEQSTMIDIKMKYDTSGRTCKEDQMHFKFKQNNHEMFDQEEFFKQSSNKIHEITLSQEKRDESDDQEMNHDYNSNN